MKVLLLSQVFYPDVVAVSQHMSDLGVALTDAGHEVTVISARRGYDDPTQIFAQEESWKGICIHRASVLGLGKKSKLRRIVGFASFFVTCSLKLFSMPRQDAVVVTTTPPLLSILAALFVKARGGQLLYWSMDLNPDEAIAAGWMRSDSLTGRFLEFILRFSLRASDTIVVMDRFMRDRIAARNEPPDKIHIIPPWAHDVIGFDLQGRISFRKKLGLENKFVVMYSGNHSPLHPLDTLMQAAFRLKNNPDIKFLFVGGGTELQRVQAFARKEQLTNVCTLPYQSRDQLSGSLSSADLQVVVLGDPFVGCVHPCKIYNILAVGSPFLFIGPEESHIGDMQTDPEIGPMGHLFRHGDVESITDLISAMASSFIRGDYVRPNRPDTLDRFSEKALLPAFLKLLNVKKH